MLPITTILTTIPIQPAELEAVKKALGTWLKQKGFAEHGYIHNHETEEDPAYKKQPYPLAQLRCPQGRLMLWGMGTGAQILQKIMLHEMLRGFQFRGTQCRIHTAGTGTENFEIKYLPARQTMLYELNYFIALKPENFKSWQELPTAQQRMLRLQQLLINNIAMFCKAAGFTLDKEKLYCEIHWLWHTRWVLIKEHKVLAFTLTYTSNLQLPDGIALGRQTKLGYGWQTIRTNANDELLTPLP